MAKNAAQVRAYGDTSAYVGPQYTPLPTDFSAPAAAFGDVGWLSEDGITMGITRDSTDVKANGGKTVRVIRTSDGRTFKIQCLQTNKYTAGLIKPGSTPVTIGGTSEVQTIAYTGTATAGTLPMTVPGYGTITPVYNAATTAVATQLSALVGATVTVTGTPGTSYVITFPVSMGNVPSMVAPYTAATGLTASSVTTTTPGVNGITTTPVVSTGAQDIRAWVLDANDGSIHNRFTIGSGEVTAVADISYKGSGETLYELTITPYPDANGVMYTEITDDPALAV